MKNKHIEHLPFVPCDSTRWISVATKSVDTNKKTIHDQGYTDG